MSSASMKRRLVAEALGTASLVAAVVGSGIMAERLAQNAALALLANTAATACALAVLITIFGPISGAHFNPVVTLVAKIKGGMRAAEAWSYVVVQFGGATLGVFVANTLFGLAPFSLSRTARDGVLMGASEFVATFGLVCTIELTAAARPNAVPLTVAGYIAAAYWFTPSTSFANPAVAFARALTDTFTGIAPASTPVFFCGQVLGALAATAVSRFLLKDSES